MKKQSLSWLVLLLAVVLSVGFASCKDDDDDGGNTSIIGTWRGDYSSGYYLITFREDGTGVEQEYDREDGMGEGMLSADPFSWAQDGDRIIIRYDDGYKETYEDVSISGNTLTFVNPDGYSERLTRQ